MTVVFERVLRVNGIAMRVVEAGAGPLVVLCHGFPELSHSWRHQLPALAETGYHAVAPDMRGYGGGGRGLNWYRNVDRNREVTPEVAGARVEVPALFVAGRATRSSPWRRSTRFEGT